MEKKEGDGELATPPQRAAPPLVRMLRCEDLPAQRVLNFLEPVDVITGLTLLSREVSTLIQSSFCAEAFWKSWLLKSFRYVDRQANRSRGYYKRLYLSLTEEGLEEHNLISGGH
ncbi:MAG: hypothetical protein EBZ48_17285 [Proteobacteria bacterium]|nr:hypothetical protein [Pseudomonadota bacterium]